MNILPNNTLLNNTHTTVIVRGESLSVLTCFDLTQVLLHLVISAGDVMPGVGAVDAIESHHGTVLHSGTVRLPQV